MHLLPLCVTLSGLLPAIIASQLSNRSNITSQSLPSDGTFWHLDQLDGVMDNKYSYPEQAGEGVEIYVIDSGIYTAHEVFAGRASVIANFVSTEANDDLAGHGTRVAGIAAMVAKKAKVIGIKVLDSNAAVYYPTNETNLPSSWIQGIRFAIQQIMESKRPSVINMSINSGQKDDVDAAVREAAKSNYSYLGQKLRTLTKTTIVGELPPGTPPWIASLELVG
ncbi:peptidase S8/S53 domain-containing protein [Paraphysoderma sedebokerense]|nr:peptidase S8/S53 domain-containing protein [Paraphysoderma sedebokerense]